MQRMILILALIFMNSHNVYGAIDDLYQKNVRFSKLKLFFSMRCIRLSTVYSVQKFHFINSSQLIIQALRLCIGL